MIKFLVLELKGFAQHTKPPPGYAIPDDGV
ncbi:MAG: hypothetical protein ACI8VW_000727 [bacterium]|jgi:hypothetical protein